MQSCRACELYECATRGVIGEGPAPSEMMLVGEQPGDREDLEGRPFVGPAGRLLDEALQDAGLDRDTLFLTNAVKHFRFQERGKRRIHQRPDRRHIEACRPWLEAELAIVKPRVLVCLGAIATQALLGSSVKVTRDRGRPLDFDLADDVLVTVHPSSILRQRGAERYAAQEQLAADLSVAAAALH